MTSNMWTEVYSFDAIQCANSRGEIYALSRTRRTTRCRMEWSRGYKHSMCFKCPAVDNYQMSSSAFRFIRASPSRHIPYVEIDQGTGHVKILDYTIGHDCGTIINPDIVRGMVIGGLVHGIGAALYEKFAYRPDGQFESATFADYLMPSVYEVPMVKDVDHCTPSPLTSHGQKGRRGGILGLQPRSPAP